MQIAHVADPDHMPVVASERPSRPILVPPPSVTALGLPKELVSTRQMSRSAGYRFTEVRSRGEWFRLTQDHPQDSIFLSWGWGEYKRSIGWEVERLQIMTPAGGLFAICTVATKKRFGARLMHVQGGPLLTGVGNDDDVARMLTEMAGYLRLGSFDVLAISPYAFSSNRLVMGLLSAGYLPIVNRSHFTLVLDLTRGIGPIRDGLGKRWRRSLKDAAGHLTVRFPENRSSRAAALERFAPMYRDLSRRKGFRGSAVIEKMGAAVIDDPRFVLLEVLDGETVVASRIAHVAGDVMTDFIAATSEQGLEHHAGYFAAWSLIEKAVDMRLRQLDCGGIDPFVNPGVFQFKRGVSKDVRQSEPIWIWSRSKLVRNAIQVWKNWG